MMEYYCDLVGLRIVLRTPDEINISESLRPFLCPPQENIDCAIELHLQDRLPAFADDGVWHGPEYYDCCDGVTRIFHCKAPKTAAFAVTQLLQNGNIEIGIVPQYLSYFTGSAGIFNRIGMETLLQQHSGLLLHASLIKYNQKTIAFSGPSGAGKSTQANIWNQYLAADVLNGDRAAIRRTNAIWMGFGSPYAGTSGIYRNDGAPLAAVVVLRQAKENRFYRLRKTDAFRHLYPELSVHYWDKAFVAKASDLCLQLLEEVPAYMLECRPEESAALLVKKGLGL